MLLFGGWSFSELINYLTLYDKLTENGGYCLELVGCLANGNESLGIWTWEFKWELEAIIQVEITWEQLFLMFGMWLLGLDIE